MRSCSCLRSSDLGPSVGTSGVPQRRLLSSMSRTPIVGGNWKCTPGSVRDANALLGAWEGRAFDKTKVEVVICPTSLHLPVVKLGRVQGVLHLYGGLSRGSSILPRSPKKGGRPGDSRCTISRELRDFRIRGGPVAIVLTCIIIPIRFASAGARANNKNRVGGWEDVQQCREAVLGAGGSLVASHDAALRGRPLFTSGGRLPPVQLGSMLGPWFSISFGKGVVSCCHAVARPP